VSAPQGPNVGIHHTTLHLYSLIDLYLLKEMGFEIVVLACVVMVMLGVVGFCTLDVTLLTRTSCGFLWQTALVTAADAKKVLFTNLSKPKNVVEAPAIADNVAVDARNLALLFSVGMMPNTRDDFSYVIRRHRARTQKFAKHSHVRPSRQSFRPRDPRKAVPLQLHGNRVSCG